MKSDVEELMPRLLPVELGQNTEDVDLSGPPRNPQEYLRQVQLVQLFIITCHNCVSFSETMCFKGFEIVKYLHKNSIK